MTKAAIWALFILATAAVITGLVYFKETLTQIILAVILFIGVGGMARWFKQKIPRLPRWGAGLIAVAFIFSLVAVVVAGVADNIGEFRQQSGAYQARIDQIAANLYRSFGANGPAPTVHAVMSKVDAAEFLGFIAKGFEGIASSALFIVIYLGFMLAASLRVSQKFDQLFPAAPDRAHASNVLTAIRKSMEQYLWTQTVVSGMITIVTYFTLLALGLDHALFWSSLIFLLNFIPTIGTIVGFILPTLFALVQFPDLFQPALIGISIFSVHFVIGHFVQPKMMGRSLNLSALVVLLALELWGRIWGIPGAFLAAPLTVMIMIVLAQFSNTRWIAVLLSADGKPSVLAAQHGGETEAGVGARLNGPTHKPHI